MFDEIYISEVSLDGMVDITPALNEPTLMTLNEQAH